MSFILAAWAALLCAGAGEAPAFPHVQATPWTGHRILFEIDGASVAEYHFDPSYARPFVFPLVGPAGRPLTRLTHPHDPEGHGHHLSIWVGHQKVNDANFWENGACRIAHEAIESIDDGADSAAVTVRNRWRNADGSAALTERRTIRLQALAQGERYLDITIELKPAGGDVTFGETPFGLLAVRVAKTMSVNDGGGTIRNSEGAINEEGVFWHPARWVDYTGLVTPDERNGITFFDHPTNAPFPSTFHVRNDGWMGACISKEAPRPLPAGQALVLRYRLYAHGPAPTPEDIERRWQEWATAAAPAQASPAP